MSKLKRFTRFAVATMAISVLAAGPLTTGAAAAGLSTFNSNANGFALRVTTDLSGLPQAVRDQIQTGYTTARNALPAAQQAELPVAFPFVIDQYFAKTTTDASNTATKAVSVLGEGFRNLGSVTATTVGQTESSTLSSGLTLPGAGLSIVSAETGKLKASVAAGPKVDGNANVATVSATLANISSFLPAQLQAAFDELVTQVNGVVSTANTTLDTVTDEVSAALAGTPLASDPVVGPVVSDATALASSINLPSLSDVLDGSVATVTGVDNTSTAQQTATGASADSVSTIKAVDILDGFVNVGLINLASHSEAAGTPGSAKNTSACSIADVRLGGNTGVSFDGTNLYVESAGSPVALPVPTDQIAGVKSQVDSLLSQTGLSVKLCDAAQQNAAADGTSASQAVSAFVITFEPKAVTDIAALGMTAGQSLMKITIDPTVGTSVSATPQVAAAAPVLPVTGGPALATMLTGAILTGTGLILRRKVR